VVATIAEILGFSSYAVETSQHKSPGNPRRARLETFVFSLVYACFPMAEQFPVTFVVTAQDAGLRLDQFLVNKLASVSRARVQEIIADAKVLVSGTVPKASLRLKGGERVEVLGPAQAPPLRAVAEDIRLDIVYEDEYLAVVNKPAGMMVHAGAGATDEARNRGTLVNALLHRFAELSELGGGLRPGIVHRLDRGTSGLIVIAKNDESHRGLAEQFAHREAKKTYLGLVHGWLQQDKGTLRSQISRDPIRRNRMTTRGRIGREAITHYKVLTRLSTPYGKFTFLELKIDTGRTHQIRVHMASLGHPVVGDTLYGAAEKVSSLKKAGRSMTISLGRNFLHSTALEITHPVTGQLLSFLCPLPPELDDFLALLQEKGKAGFGL
jgi:23S rRNA pseudouridine1911/1915/1917 synthase